MSGDAAFDVTGSDDARRLAAALRDVGRDLRAEMVDHLQATTGPVEDAVRSNLTERLPRSGGLAALGSGAQVTATAVSDSTSAGLQWSIQAPGINLPGVDDGVVSHPVFGQKPNVRQAVRRGAVSDAVASRENDVEQAVVAAVDAVTDRVEESL